MKYSFIMPYLDRSAQFFNTLESFWEFYTDRHDFEIIVVMDSKCKEESVLRSSLPMRVLRVENPGYSPVTLYNAGVRKSTGEYLIITNPECLHEDDILGELDKKLEADPDAYYVARCKYESVEGKKWMWSQHPEHHPSLLHFCSCISRKNYDKIGGFDEEFSEGYCFDDDAFRDAVRLADIHIHHLLGCVFHQAHAVDYKKMPNRTELWMRNQKLWTQKYLIPLEKRR